MAADSFREVGSSIFSIAIRIEGASGLPYSWYRTVDKNAALATPSTRAIALIYGSMINWLTDDKTISNNGRN